MSEPILPLEPQALELRRDHDGQMRLSVAISLKRIADAIHSESEVGSVLYWLEQIARATDGMLGR